MRKPGHVPEESTGMSVFPVLRVLGVDVAGSPVELDTCNPVDEGE